MNDLTTTVDTYLAAWNETDQGQRRALIEKAWTADGRLIDGRLRRITGFFGDLPTE